MTLPDGLKQLTTVEEVRAAWGDLFVVSVDGGEETVAFAENPRIAITVDAVFIKLKKPVHAGKEAESTDTIRIPEPTVNDVRQADKSKSEFEKAINLVASLCKIPGADINAMAASEMVLIQEVIGAFLYN